MIDNDDFFRTWDAKTKEGIARANADMNAVGLSGQEAFARLSKTMESIAVPAMQNFVDVINRAFASFAKFHQVILRGQHPPRRSRSSAWKRGKDRAGRSGK